jgi:predicted O-methyltransferase YrrM
MRPKYFSVQSPQVDQYVFDLLKIEKDKELFFVLENARKKGTPPLQVVPTDGRTLEVLARSIMPKKILEIGTLCGYSTVNLARALAEGGKLYTCERSKHHAETAQEAFVELGLEHKVEIVFGDAMDNLKNLSQFGPFDLVFIDADKLNYPNYFDWTIENLRQGGLLIADNVFVFDHISDDPVPVGSLGEMVLAMREFNKKCVDDKRLVTTILPTGEGLLVSVKL